MTGEGKLIAGENQDDAVLNPKRQLINLKPTCAGRPLTFPTLRRDALASLNIVGAPGLEPGACPIYRTALTSSLTYKL